jgi:hypothetical protein
MHAAAAAESMCGLMTCCCRSTEANKYTQQELLLMKTQDAKYLGLKSRTEAAVSNGYASSALLLPCLQLQSSGTCLALRRYIKALRKHVACAGHGEAEQLSKLCYRMWSFIAQCCRACCLAPLPHHLPCLFACTLAES